MAKSVFKFSGVMIIIVLIGVSALMGLQYFRYRSSPEYLAEQNLKNLDTQYAEDSYGGSTPEETLALFIDALKAGDTDLASKYFVLDAQAQWREDLAVMKEKGFLDDMIGDLERTKKYRSSTETQVFFTAGNISGEAVINIDMIKFNEKWKIRGI